MMTASARSKLFVASIHITCRACPTSCCAQASCVSCQRAHLEQFSMYARRVGQCDISVSRCFGAELVRSKMSLNSSSLLSLENIMNQQSPITYGHNMINQRYLFLELFAFSNRDIANIDNTTVVTANIGLEVYIILAGLKLCDLGMMLLDESSERGRCLENMFRSINFDNPARLGRHGLAVE